jgi:branched-chain amino acid transport system substrate-binding protein
MTSSTRLRRLVALLLLLAVLGAACGSDDDSEEPAAASEDSQSDGGAAADEPAAEEPAADGDADEPATEPASGDPILIGVISSTSGIQVFPEPAVSAQLVFDRYNAAGGLDGRPIELIVVDDQDTAEGAASAARQLVEEEGVHALGAGGSIVDCTTNAGYYEEMGMEVVPAVAACAAAATVHPVNTGPFLPAIHGLDFFAKDLGLTTLCTVGENSPLVPIFESVFFPAFEAETGLTLNNITLEPGDDFTPAVTKLAADGCEGVMTLFTEPGYQSFFQAVSAQGLRDEITWAMLTSGYSQTLLDAAGDNLEGVYAASEFEPYTGDPSVFSADVQDYLALMDSIDERPTSFGQGGWLAAHVLIAAAESVEGEVTRESLNEAIRNIVFESEMLGGPYTASGFEGPVQPNPYSLMVQVQDGEFERVSDFVTFPRSAG